MTAFRAVMASPLVTFGTDTVSTAEILRTFRTAILAHTAIGTDLHAVFAFAALLAGIGAIGTVFAAVDADAVGTVTAVIAFATHYVGAVDANAAIGAEFVDTF